MRVTVAVDNIAPDSFNGELGLSFLVETINGSMLFDTGQSGRWLVNLSRMGKDLSTLKVIALSHGHYDHTGGISSVSEWIETIRCYAHPDTFNPKYALDTVGIRFIGTSDMSLQYKSLFITNRDPIEIMPGITLSGEIPIRTESAVTVHGKFFLDENRCKPDNFEDEQCLILKNGDSIGVLLGCSHRGVENNIRAAMNVAGTDRLEWIAGGMHLASAGTEQLDELCSFLNSMNIGQIICCHCTGDTAFRYLREHIGDKVIQGYAGMQWSLPELKT